MSDFSPEIRASAVSQEELHATFKALTFLQKKLFSLAECLSDDEIDEYREDISPVFYVRGSLYDNSFCLMRKASHQFDAPALILKVYLSNKHVVKSFCYIQNNFLVVNTDYNDIIFDSVQSNRNRKVVPIPSVLDFDLSTEEGEFQYSLLQDRDVLGVMKYLQYITKLGFNYSYSTWFSPEIIQAAKDIESYERRFSTED